MHDYYCSLCKHYYSKDYTMVNTKKGPLHCVYCISDRLENIGYHYPKRIQKILEIENEYAEDIKLKLLAHEL